MSSFPFALFFVLLQFHYVIDIPIVRVDSLRKHVLISTGCTNRPLISRTTKQNTIKIALWLNETSKSQALPFFDLGGKKLSIA